MMCYRERRRCGYNKVEPYGLKTEIKTLFFSPKGIEQKKEKYIKKEIVGENGVQQTKQEDIAEVIRSYYQRLFTSEV